MSKRRGFAVVIAIIVMTTVASIAFLMNSPNPKAALLYTTHESIPNVAFQIVSVPLAIASLLKYQQRVFSLLPATNNNTESSLGNTEFLIIGVHGSNGFIFSDEKTAFGPLKIPNLKMKLVYFGSCYFGSKRDLWQRFFPNAKLIGQDGLAYQFTSALYLFFVAPITLLFS